MTEQAYAVDTLEGGGAVTVGIAVQLVVHTVAAHALAVKTPVQGHGTALRPDTLYRITGKTLRITGVYHVHQVYVAVAIGIVLREVYLVVCSGAGIFQQPGHVLVGTRVIGAAIVLV